MVHKLGCIKVTSKQSAIFPDSRQLRKSKVSKASGRLEKLKNLKVGARSCGGASGKVSRFPRGESAVGPIDTEVVKLLDGRQTLQDRGSDHSL